MSSELGDIALAELFRELLKLVGKSQRDLSRDIGVPYRSVQKYLSGETRIPASFLIAVCRCLDVEVDFLINGDFRPRQTTLYDAVIRALDDASLLPSRNDLSNAPKRAELAGLITATIRENYDRYRREDISKKTGRG